MLDFLHWLLVRQRIE